MSKVNDTGRFVVGSLSLGLMAYALIRSVKELISLGRDWRQELKTRKTNK